MQVFRDILVAVVGLTPQIITETVYYLIQVRQPPATLAAIHVLTTSPGQERVVTQLLAPRRGHFHTLCAEYGLDAAAIAFEIHVLRDAGSGPLEDIRTASDSAAVADQITTLVRHLTNDPTTRLFCSLAGGRKTQAVLLGFALQLYGRPHDVLLHVLVDDAFQDHPEFFYPSRASHLVRTRDNRLRDAQSVRIDVAEIPYLRLRDKLFPAPPSAEVGFAPAIAQAQQTLDALPKLPPLVFTGASRRIHIGAIAIALQPLELALYTQLAWTRWHQAQSQTGDGWLTLDELEAMRHDIFQRYRRLYGLHAGRVAALRQQWDRGLSREGVRSHFANINRKIRQALSDPAQAVWYQVDRAGPYGQKRYGLRLAPANIELREE